MLLETGLLVTRKLKGGQVGEGMTGKIGTTTPGGSG